MGSEGKLDQADHRVKIDHSVDRSNHPMFFPTAAIGPSSAHHPRPASPARHSRSDRILAKFQNGTETSLRWPELIGLKFHVERGKSRRKLTVSVSTANQVDTESETICPFSDILAQCQNGQLGARGNADEGALNPSHEPLSGESPYCVGNDRVPGTLAPFAPINPAMFWPVKGQSGSVDPTRSPNRRR